MKDLIEVIFFTGGAAIAWFKIGSAVLTIVLLALLLKRVHDKLYTVKDLIA